LRELDPILFDKFLITVCKGHSAANLPQCLNTFKTYARSDPGVRYAMLAGLLLLADELDVSRERARLRYPFFHEFNDYLRLIGGSIG